MRVDVAQFLHESVIICCVVKDNIRYNHILDCNIIRKQCHKQGGVGLIARGEGRKGQLKSHDMIDMMILSSPSPLTAVIARKLFIEV